MDYRTLGRSGVKVSVMSFGGMRIPGISEEESFKVVNKAIDLKMNYFETAPGYSDSEIRLGKALGKRRKDIFLSTKTMVGSIESEYATDAKTEDQFRKKLDSQLKRLQTDYLDFYQMWCVNSMDNFKRGIAKGNLYDGMNKARKEGMIKHLGITTHAEPKEVLEFLKTDLFESVTVYYNALKQEYEEVISYAKGHDIGVVAMGPLNGGMLAENNGKMNVIKTGKAKSNAEGALCWLAHNTGVTTSIVGCKSVEDVEQACNVGSNYKDIMSKQEADEITGFMKKLRQNIKDNYCTWCDYCKPCSQDMVIHEYMDILTVYDVYGAEERSRNMYKELKKKPSECTGCNECAPKCPQKIRIPEEMKRLEKLFGGGK